MIEMLTSDPAILVFAGVGLVATGVSILRDARAQRRDVAPQLTIVSQSADVAVERTQVAA
jgi:hypothetical protein